MANKFLIFFVLFFSTLLINSCAHVPTKTAQQAFRVDIPNTAAAKRATELLFVINNGVKSQVVDYLAQNADKTLQDMAFLVMVHRYTHISASRLYYSSVNQLLHGDDTYLHKARKAC